jgi:hypothetical protein
MSETNLYINNEQESYNEKQLKIMVFITNALENGWTVKKKDNQYTFTKKHEGKKEVFNENYLENFIKDNFDMNILQHT